MKTHIPVTSKTPTVSFYLRQRPDDTSLRSVSFICEATSAFVAAKLFRGLYDQEMPRIRFTATTLLVRRLSPDRAVPHDRRSPESINHPPFIISLSSPIAIPSLVCYLALQ